MRNLYQYNRPVKQKTGIRDQNLPLITIVMFFVFNILLAYFSRVNSFFATYYAIGVFIVGILLLIHNKNPVRVMYLCAYIVGAELIWRSTEAGVFYEFGKYSIIVLLILSMLKWNLFPLSNKWPITYFILLLPSIFLLPFFDRQIISFYLSGPLLLAVSTMYFSAVYINRDQIKKILLAILGPTVGMGFLALYSTLTNVDILSFGTQSNFVTSGGFGPVQVSAQLGLGALLAFYYFVSEKKDRFVSMLMLVLAVWLIAQTVFTFSRTGVYNAVLAMLMGGFFILRENRQRISFLFGGGLVLIIFVFVVFPFMDDFTGNQLGLRFQETRSLGRELLMKSDWNIFLSNPIFGVGPGQAKFLHSLFGIDASSHTEYTRLLSEHGSLGLTSLLILFGLVLSRFLKKTTPEQKGIVVLLTIWVIVYMVSISLRTAAPSFIFGLGGAMFLLDDEYVDETKRLANR